MKFYIEPEEKDFEKLNITKQKFLDDILLLDVLGYDYTKNIVKYLHETADIIRWIKKDYE